MSRTSYPIVERLADQVIVTARSTVEAQQAAGEAMGGDCTIISVERVHEGGIGGFFATELVRVTARPSRFHRADRELDAAMTSAEELVSSLRVSSPLFADRLMSELRQPARQPQDMPFDDEQFDDEQFDDEQLDDEPGVEHDEPLVVQPYLAEQLIDDDRLDDRFDDDRFDEVLIDATVPLSRPIEIAAPVVAPRVIPQVVTPPVTIPEIVRAQSVQVQSVQAQVVHRCSPGGDPDRAPAIVPRRASAPTDPRWSHQTLRALGLPDRLVDIAMLQRPVEGPQWIMALMGAFRTLCSPPPVGPTVLVGPSCANLDRQLRIVSVGADELSESLSSVAIPNVST
ncbi:MAG: hypothetical protein JWR83_3242, partial [Aeromicrobium sp.]|nr:hypothetical protein [Aeromicrobium sp.]